MKTKLLLCAAVVLSSLAAAQAQSQPQAQSAGSTPAYGYGNPYSNTPVNGSTWFAQDPNDIYRAYELSLDAFGSVASSGRGHDFYGGNYHHRRDSGGGGGGLEYFFSRYAGIEVESFANANDHHTASALGGNLVLRWPVGDTGFAPYIFGGGGEEWTYRSEGYGDGGAGLEYRFTRNIGLFGDGRFVDPDHTHNYGMGRIGVRFIF